ncbi:MAG TPA: hypothetical protein VJ926_00100 [Patescibacteria group bacterium]|nr:hypothetical protein [Patescibacteria group bacterium]
MMLAFIVQVESQAQDADLNEHSFIKKSVDSSNYVVYLQSETVMSKIIDQNKLISRVDIIYDSIGFFKHVDKALLKLNKDYWLKAFVNADSIIKIPVDSIIKYSKTGFDKDVQIKRLLVIYSSTTNNLEVFDEDSTTISGANIDFQFLLLLTLFLALWFAAYKRIGLVLINIIILILGVCVIFNLSTFFNLKIIVNTVLIAFLGLALIWSLANKKTVILVAHIIHIVIIVALAIKMAAILTLTSMFILFVWLALTSLLCHKLLLYYFKKNKEDD